MPIISINAGQSTSIADLLKTRYGELKNYSCHIGYGLGTTASGEIPEEQGASLAERAYKNEYGTSKIPARPFMHITAENNGRKWLATLKGAVQNGYTFKEALVMVGEVGHKDVMQTIESHVPPPNSPATIAAKRARGRTHPETTLIDTGEMQKGVSYEVVEA